LARLVFAKLGQSTLKTAATRKLKDPKRRGPDGATLHFEIKFLTDNQVVLTFNCNAWGAIHPGKPAIDYSAAKELKGLPDWQQVSVSLKDLVSIDAKVTPLTNWQSVTEFSISPSGTALKDGKKLKVGGKAWKGTEKFATCDGWAENIKINRLALRNKRCQSIFGLVFKLMVQTRYLARAK